MAVCLLFRAFGLSHDACQLAASSPEAQRSASAKIFSLYSGENTGRVRFFELRCRGHLGDGQLGCGLGHVHPPQAGAPISMLSDTLSVWTEFDTWDRIKLGRQKDETYTINF